MIPQSSLISSAFARALLRTVAEAGLDVSEFLRPEAISQSELESCDEISAELLARLYERAIVLLKDESVGLVSGGPVPTGTFRMMCLCVIHRPTLKAIVRRAGEFFDICKSVSVKPEILEFRIHESITFATVESETRSVDEILDQEGLFRIRGSLFMWHSLLSWFAGRRLPLQKVVFNFEEPARGSEWSGLFHCPVEFNGSRSMLCFNPGVLDAPNVQTEQTLSVFLKSAPYRLIAPSFNDHKLRERVLALFGDDLTQPLPRADQIGKLLGLSVSTLRRQLREEGTSFQKLKDDYRRAAALRYLATNTLSFSEIAELLGFDEPSAFYRAFKRWTGCTPSEYRVSLSQS